MRFLGRSFFEVAGLSRPSSSLWFYSWPALGMVAAPIDHPCQLGWLGSRRGHQRFRRSALDACCCSSICEKQLRAPVWRHVSRLLELLSSNTIGRHKVVGGGGRAGLDMAACGHPCCHSSFETRAAPVVHLASGRVCSIAFRRFIRQHQHGPPSKPVWAMAESARAFQTQYPSASRPCRSQRRCGRLKFDASRLQCFEWLRFLPHTMTGSTAGGLTAAPKQFSGLPLLPPPSGATAAIAVSVHGYQRPASPFGSGASNRDCNAFVVDFSGLEALEAPASQSSSESHLSLSCRRTPCWSSGRARGPGRPGSAR